jgi:hypothetical protein
VYAYARIMSALMIPKEISLGIYARARRDTSTSAREEDTSEVEKR